MRAAFESDSPGARPIARKLAECHPKHYPPACLRPPSELFSCVASRPPFPASKSGRARRARPVRLGPESNAAVWRSHLFRAISFPFRPCECQPRLNQPANIVALFLGQHRGNLFPDIPCRKVWIVCSKCNDRRRHKRKWNRSHGRSLACPRGRSCVSRLFRLENDCCQKSGRARP